MEKGAPIEEIAVISFETPPKSIYGKKGRPDILRKKIRVGIGLANSFLFNTELVKIKNRKGVRIQRVPPCGLFFFLHLVEPQRTEGCCEKNRLQIIKGYNWEIDKMVARPSDANSYHRFAGRPLLSD
jgi:hypothetical protein